MSPIEAKFLRWIRRVKRGGSGRLVLGHVEVAGRGAQLGEWPVRDEDPLEALEELARDVMQVAGDDTDGQSAHTPQQYMALYFTDGGRDAYSRFKFRIAPPASDFSGGPAVSSEPPTESGLVAQAMRFLEMGQRASWGGMGTAVQVMQQQLQRADERDARHEERHERRDARYFALLDKLERYHTEEHLRETATMAAHHEAEDRRALFNNIALLGSSMLTKLGAPASPPALPAVASGAPSEAPVTAASVATGAVVGTGTPAPSGPMPTIDPALFHHIRLLMDSLQPEQLEAIQKVLTMEQAIALATLYNAVMAKAPGESAVATPDAPESRSAPATGS